MSARLHVAARSEHGGVWRPRPGRRAAPGMRCCVVATWRYWPGSQRMLVGERRAW